MGGGRQSEQPPEAPMTPVVSDTGNEVQHQLSGTSVESPAQRRGRFHLSTPKIGLPAIIVTALVGFFFGIASNQVSDFVKRSEDCVEGLEPYLIGVENNFLPAVSVLHDPNSSVKQKTDIDDKLAALVDVPYYKILAKCPVTRRHTEYLDSYAAKRFLQNRDKMMDCLTVHGCPTDDQTTVIAAELRSGDTLLNEAEEVSNWGLLRRAKYLLTHLY